MEDGHGEMIEVDARIIGEIGLHYFAVIIHPSIPDSAAHVAILS